MKCKWCEACKESKSKWKEHLQTNKHILNTLHLLSNKETSTLTTTKSYSHTSPKLNIDKQDGVEWVADPLSNELLFNEEHSIEEKTVDNSASSNKTSKANKEYASKREKRRALFNLWRTMKVELISFCLI